MTAATEFLELSARELTQHMSRIEACVQRLTPQQIWTRAGANQNAVGNLLLHLNGNVRQWILHGIGGEPDVRARDAEFAAQGGASAAELTARLRATVEEAAELFRALPAERLLDRTATQGYDYSVLGAIYHVVGHFTGHTYQIMYATKLFTGEDLGFYAHLNSSAPQVPLP
jgi:hypothetical protein